MSQGAHRLVTTNVGDLNANSATTDVDTIAPVINDMANRSGSLTGNQRQSYNSFLNDSNDSPGTPRNSLWIYTSCLSYGCSNTQLSLLEWLGRLCH